MPTEKKKKKERIKELELENQQLRTALAASRDYADKLVDSIPYLPKDIEVLREANTAFAAENEHLHKLNNTLLKLLHPSLDIAKDFMDESEFPGPYVLEAKGSQNLSLRNFVIKAKTGEVVLETNYQYFAKFCLEILGSFDRHIKAGH
jgi:hypothetical protein